MSVAALNFKKVPSGFNRESVNDSWDTVQPRPQGVSLKGLKSLTPKFRKEQSLVIEKLQTLQSLSMQIDQTHMRRMRLRNGGVKIIPAVLLWFKKSFADHRKII